MDPFQGQCLDLFWASWGLFEILFGSHFGAPFWGLVELILVLMLVSFWGVFLGLLELSASFGAHFGLFRADFPEGPPEPPRGLKMVKNRLKEVHN